MPVAPSFQHNAALRAWGRYAALLIGGVLLFRLFINAVNPLGLHGDEAQYWAWSRDLDWGYFSKPPLIAWVIAASTSLFGHAEWAIRLPSPILHSFAAALTFLSARRLYGGQAGLIACALYLLMPGVSLSAALISTDAVLLTCLSGAIYCWIRLRDEPQWRWATGLGVAIGAGFLAKYAMIYILPALITAALLEPRTRRALLGARGAACAVVAGLIVLPNILWNARNSFVTLSHTSANANLEQGASVNPIEWAEFAAGQFGVFGPISFALLLIALSALLKPAKSRPEFSFWLAVFVLTPLLVISVQALISRANANWAAAAYAGAPILLAGWAARPQSRTWVRGSLFAAIGLNGALAFAAPVIMTQPAWVDKMGFANSVKRLRAWPETVARIEARLAAGHYDAVAVDNRLVFYDLTYYGLADRAPLLQWRYDPDVDNHAELTSPLPDNDPRTILLLSVHDDYASYFADDFNDLTREADMVIDLGGGKERRFRVYRASGYKTPTYRQKTAP